MTTTMKVGAWGAAAVAVILSVLFSPVLAGYVFVAAAFAVIAVLMAMQLAQAISDWRLDHPWKFHRRTKRA